MTFQTVNIFFLRLSTHSSAAFPFAKLDDKSFYSWFPFFLRTKIFIINLWGNIKIISFCSHSLDSLGRRFWVRWFFFSTFCCWNENLLLVALFEHVTVTIYGHCAFIFPVERLLRFWNVNDWEYFMFYKRFFSRVCFRQVSLMTLKFCRVNLWRQPTLNHSNCYHDDLLLSTLHVNSTWSEPCRCFLNSYVKLELFALIDLHELNGFWFVISFVFFSLEARM